MTITTVERDFAAFWRVPFAIHPPSYLGVQPMRRDLRRMLDWETNPAFDSPDRVTWFTARRGTSDCGRITAHIHDDANRRFGTRTGYVGFFDCVASPEVARALVERAGDWLRARGCDEVVANVNLTTTQQMGVVTDGFEHAPYADQVYNAPHIPALLDGLGFTATFPMTTYECAVRDARRATHAIEAVDRALVPRPLRVNAQDLETCRTVLNASFASNPHFVPVSREAFAMQTAELAWILDERLSAVWTRDGHPVGVLVCIPDLNPFLRATRSRVSLGTPWHALKYRVQRRRALLVFSGVTPGHQGRGLGRVMVRHALRALDDAGYTHLGITWVADDNTACRRVLELSGAMPLHRTRLFRRAL